MDKMIFFFLLGLLDHVVQNLIYRRVRKETGFPNHRPGPLGPLGECELGLEVSR